jgi:hypothetical protein
MDAGVQQVLDVDSIHRGAFLLFMTRANFFEPGFRFYGISFYCCTGKTGVNPSSRTSRFGGGLIMAVPLPKASESGPSGDFLHLKFESSQHGGQPIIDSSGNNKKIDPIIPIQRGPKR